MPHIVLEYSANLENFLSIGGLVEALHQRAAGIEALPLGGIRVRAHRTNINRTGDGDPRNGFIYAVVRLGHGRSEAVKDDIKTQLFETLCSYTKAHFESNPLSLGLELQEIPPGATLKKNNLHERLKKKT